MNDNNWKRMGRQQIVTGLKYLEKINPSSDSTGKGVLLIIQGARFMFGIDPDEYLKKNYKVSGSYSEIADQLGDMYSNAEWEKRMWKFLDDQDADFSKVQKQIAQKKNHERQQQKNNEMHQAYLIRYPHLSELEQEMQNAIIKGGQAFGKNQPDKTSPVNEINVKTSDTKMDIFVAKIEIKKPKSIVTKQSEYDDYTATINMKTNNVTFSDNGVIYQNALKKTHKSSENDQGPFTASGTFKNIINLQPFFMQYLMMCKQQYQKLGIK